jgi:hypothetical protein
MVLIFSIPQSMTTSVKIQYQIISLITLRNVFKDIAAFDSFDFSSDLHVLQKILFDMGGGILMFGLVALFHCIVIKHGKLKQVESEGKLKAFIMSKKIVSALLALLLCYFSVKSFYFWATDVYGVAYLGEDPSINYKTLFYVDLFSVMIFTDILILLISMVYNSSYEILMRNAGFVVSTVMIRISFSLVSPYNNIVAALAILSGSIVLWITHIYKDKNND